MILFAFYALGIMQVNILGSYMINKKLPIFGKDYNTA